jgi:hypothetical protein
VLPRSALADFVAAQDRPDPVDLLESQARSRISGLVPVRYGRMLQSRFAFFRGAALLTASDLASAPRTGRTAQLCGDAHVSNFGVADIAFTRFAGAYARQNERDYAALREAVASGRVTAEADL